MSLNPRAVLNRPDAASRGNLPENPKFHEKSKGACLRRRVPSSIWTQRRSSTPRVTPRGWVGGAARGLTRRGRRRGVLRRDLRPQRAARSRAAAAPRRPGARIPALWPDRRCGRGQRAPSRRPRRDDRRARRAHLQGARRALERARERLAQGRARGRGGGRDSRPQPPRVPRSGVRCGQVWRAHRPAQHLVRRAPDQGGGDARGDRSARLRRGVRGHTRGHRRSAAGALPRLGGRPRGRHA